MFNVLLDDLPEEWHGYPIDSDYQTGILMSQCLADSELNDTERIYTAINLLFPDESSRPDVAEAMEGVSWFLNEFNHDNYDKTEHTEKVMDFDVDQWRIYAAFRNQYGIDLSREKLHWFVFMGLLGNLEECSFGRVMDIRTEKITSKMSPEEKKAYKEAKKIYALVEEEELTAEDRAIEESALEEFNRLRNRGI